MTIKQYLNTRLRDSESIITLISQGRNYEALVEIRTENNLSVQESMLLLKLIEENRRIEND